MLHDVRARSRPWDLLLLRPDHGLIDCDVIGTERFPGALLRQVLSTGALAVIGHRDLKPGNVLIASERGADLPQIKLADFGVSLLTGEGSGPVGLAPPRKPSSGSLRGAVLSPAAASATGSA